MTTISFIGSDSQPGVLKLVKATQKMTIWADFFIWGTQRGTILIWVYAEVFFIWVYMSTKRLRTPDLEEKGLDEINLNSFSSQQWLTGSR